MTEAHNRQDWKDAIGARVRTDEKHGDLFLPLLPKYILDQPRALNAADDALELFKLYHLGVVQAMEKSR